MSNFTLPAGYYPQLPETVTGESAAGHQYHVGATSGAHIDGHIGHVFLVEGNLDGRSYRHIDVIEDQRCASAAAWKAFCLARGFTVPWRYCGQALHPSAHDF